MKFSPSVKSFFLEKVHGNTIPVDAIDISADEYANLLNIGNPKYVFEFDVNNRPICRSITSALDDLKDEKIADISRSFIAATKSGFVTTSGIKMNADITDVQRLKSAYDLAGLLNQTVLPVVVDYDNVGHADKPLTEVLTMVIELGVNYQTLYKKKQDLRALIQASDNEAQLNTLIWS